MQFIETLQRLLESEKFTSWKKKNPDSYLAHGVFFEGPNAPWQVGFYHPSRDKLSVFDIGEEIVERDEEDAFKEGDSIQALEVNAIKCDYMLIREKMEELAVDLHESVMRRIFIVQHIQQGQVWNVTYLTNSFKTINVRFDVTTGEMTEKHVHNILDMVQKVK